MPPAPQPPELLDFLDYPSMRNRIYDGVVDAVKTKYPIENDRYRLELTDVDYKGPERYSLSDQKKAILQRNSLYRNLNGTWRLTDKATGKPVDTYKSTIAHVPFLTSRGTYILRGNEYTVSNQMRLRGGVFTRRKENGDLEAHFNIVKGGPGFRVFMEPRTGIFRMQVGQARLRMYPIMKAMGVSDAQLQKLWGSDLYQANATLKGKDSTLEKLWARLANARARNETNEKAPKNFVALLDNFKLDPEVTKRTLGQPYDRVTPEVLNRTMQKLINVGKGTEDTDDRDSLAFQETWSANDFFRERIMKDSGRLAARALWKATLRGNLSGMQPSLLTPQLDAVFFKAGVAQPLEEINALDALDQNLRITRMGEGGMSGMDTIPEEARDVQPSHFMFIDPIRTPESGRVGVDARVAFNTFKGPNKAMYTKVLNRAGKPVFLPPTDLVDTAIAFPGELQKAKREGRTHVKAMVAGELKYAPIKEVKYQAPSHQGLFTYGSNMIPLVSSIDGGRLLMGAKMQSQALPLRDAESPLVQSVDPQAQSFYKRLGKYVGAVRNEAGGQVIRVKPHQVVVKQTDGQLREYEMYDNFPLNRKTYVHNTPLVNVGDMVSKGQLLAKSNFTDDQGTVALGKNLRVAYMPYKGLNFEDAIVVSDSAAKKLASEHMYTEKMDFDNMTSAKRSAFVSMFPAQYNRAQLDKIGDDGIVMPGAIVEPDDPLILATQRRTSKGAGMLYRGAKSPFRDASVVWKHHFPGRVTDVWSDKNGVKVAVQAYAPAEVGDKLSGRYGDKGVIGAVVPDDQMPMDEGGNPLEVLLNPLGVISRKNPAQMLEAVLGKIAAKRGKPYEVPGFSDENMVEWTIKEMQKHGVKDTETLVNPETGRQIPRVLTGNRYIMKLHHTAESKESGRALGAYTMEGMPSKGQPGDDDNPKRVGLGEMQALISHGAIENIKDIKTIRGQRSDDYWRAMALGFPPPSPNIPNAYKRFMSMMQAAGINIKKRGDHLHLTAMTDKDVDEMSGGEIENTGTVRWLTEYGRGTFGEKSLDPVKGGLFDRGITGGHGGNRWSHITLSEPMPQPSMEDPIRRLLGLTKVQYENVIAGKEDIPGFGHGGGGIKRALEAINLDAAIKHNRDAVKSATSGVARDAAVKKLGYLRAMKKNKTHPADMVITKVPVLPPIFRPITATNKFNMVSGVNMLYMDLMNADKNLKEIKDQLSGDPVYDSRLNTYKALKAITGLGDPIKPERRQQRIRGLLGEVFGSSPKAGAFQRRLLGTSVDLSARSTITPNPDLNMDQVGLPEDQAWKLYAPFVVRRLVRTMGTNPSARAAAVRMVANRDSRALDALTKEMEARPVLATRAPALHRFSIMAFKPILTKGRTLQLSPSIVPGFNADFDGDAMNFHVVVSDKAIEEAKRKMLPSQNLRSPADFATLWAPRQEFLQGLYTASTKRSGRRTLPRYEKLKDVVAAFKRGDVNVEDVVSIKD